MWTKLWTALLATLYQWLPWLATWRAKLYIGIGLLVEMAVQPLLNIYVIRNDYWTMAWGGITMLCGWCAGRLIAEASRQRTRERAEEALWREVSALSQVWRQQQ